MKETTDKPAGDSDAKDAAGVPNGTDAAKEKDVANSKSEETTEKGEVNVEDKTTEGEKEEIKKPVNEESAKEGENTETAKIPDQSNRFLFEFPSPYAHELCTLRQNVIDSFVA